MEWSDYIAKSIPCCIAPVNGRPAVWLEGNFIEHVAGEQYYQTQLMQIVGGRNLPIRGSAWLVPEHDNMYDDNAVRIVINELKVGYLPKDRAALWQSVLKSLIKQHQYYVACLSEIVVMVDSRQLDVVLFLPTHLSSSAREQYVSAQLAAKNDAFERNRIEQDELREKQWAAHQEAERKQRAAEQEQRAAQQEAKQEQRAAQQEAERKQRAAQREAERQAKEQRRSELVSRFGDDSALRIISREVWLGATREMIEEAHGAPFEVDEKVMKTKIRRVLKYQRVGTNRYALKIMLENDVVVGWEGKV